MNANATAQLKSVTDVLSLIQTELKGAADDLGHFNLLAVGNTGAGKSTLINSIFGWKIAKTGNGRPVTAGTTKYDHPHRPISFFDTKGIEMGEGSKEIVGRLVDEITSRRGGKLDDQIHAVWYCIRASDRRLEDGQADVIRALAASGVPVLLTMTQVHKKDGRCHPDAVEFAESIVEMNLPLSPGSGVFLTAAMDDPWTGEAHGLEKLLDATFQVIPTGVRAALTASQQIDIDRKMKASRDIVKQHAAAAGVAAATPIPFAGSAALVPIQIAMIARIANNWGMDFPQKTMASVIGSAILTSGATLVGKTIVSNLLKFIPVYGTVAGGMLNATVASTLTMTIGHAWIAFLEKWADSPEEFSQLSDELIRSAFIGEMRGRQAAA